MRPNRFTKRISTNGRYTGPPPANLPPPPVADLSVYVAQPRPPSPSSSEEDEAPAVALWPPPAAPAQGRIFDPMIPMILQEPMPERLLYELEDYQKANRMAVARSQIMDRERTRYGGCFEDPFMQDVEHFQIHGIFLKLQSIGHEVVMLKENKVVLDKATGLVYKMFVDHRKDLVDHVNFFICEGPNRPRPELVYICPFGMVTRYLGDQYRPIPERRALTGRYGQPLSDLLRSFRFGYTDLHPGNIMWIPGDFSSFVIIEGGEANQNHPDPSIVMTWIPAYRGGGAPMPEEEDGPRYRLRRRR